MQRAPVLKCNSRRQGIQLNCCWQLRRTTLGQLTGLVSGRSRRCRADQRRPRRQGDAVLPQRAREVRADRQEGWDRGAVNALASSGVEVWLHDHWRSVGDRHRWQLAGCRVRRLARGLGALLAVFGALLALRVIKTSGLRRDRDHINQPLPNLHWKAFGLYPTQVVPGAKR